MYKTKAEAKTEREQRIKLKTKEVFDFFETIIMAFVVVALVFTFLFRIVGVKGTSMIYTLQDNDRLILTNIAYQPQKGDIVVLGLDDIFDDPIIKRIIATEGDTVDIKDGKVYINNQQIDEPYIHDATNPKNHLSYPFTVPPGEVFVMGDNRTNSTDGRNFGCVDKKTIVGKAVFRFFPFSSFGPIK